MLSLVLITAYQKRSNETSILKKEEWEMPLIIWNKNKSWKYKDWEEQRSDFK